MERLSCLHKAIVLAVFDSISRLLLQHRPGSDADSLRILEDFREYRNLIMCKVNEVNADGWCYFSIAKTFL